MYSSRRRWKEYVPPKQRPANSGQQQQKCGGHKERNRGVIKERVMIKVVSEESASIALTAALGKCFRDSPPPPSDVTLGGQSQCSIDRESCDTKLDKTTLKKRVKRRDSAKLKDVDRSDADVDADEGHSTLKKKKVRKLKRHCDIHSKSSKDPASKSDINSSAQGEQGAEDKQDPVCTCHKRSKSKLRRPEPEGGPASPFKNEYDQIINDEKPLFSDMDDDPVISMQVEKDMERFHKRVQNPDIFASALLVNSNTMLKFAIIGTELQNISGPQLRRVNVYTPPPCQA